MGETLVQPWYSKQVSGKALHALVVGVGSYPHANQQPWKLNQLPAASTSAVAVAEFIRDDLRPDDAKVATIELLANDSALTPPTFANVKAAIQRWVGRLTHKDDVALLFFAAHGMERGGQLALLCEDFGSLKHPLDPFEHAIDFPRFRIGLDSVPARRQLLIIDACRNAHKGTAGAVGTLGQPILMPSSSGAGSHSRATLHSTAPGKKAWASSQGLTRFTNALLESLRLGVATKRRGSQWLVDATGLFNATNDLLLREETRPGFSQAHKQEAWLDGGRGFVMHERTKPPSIPVSGERQGSCRSGHAACA